VESPDVLSASHTGEVGLKAIPQQLRRLGSVVVANPGMSETQFVCTYFWALARLAKARVAIRHVVQSPDRKPEYFITDIDFLLGIKAMIVNRAGIPRREAANETTTDDLRSRDRATRNEPKQDPFTMF
jgi:hypothetical protein